PLDAHAAPNPTCLCDGPKPAPPEPPRCPAEQPHHRCYSQSLRNQFRSLPLALCVCPSARPWRTHSCVPRRDSSRRSQPFTHLLASAEVRYSDADLVLDNHDLAVAEQQTTYI